LPRITYELLPQSQERAFRFFFCKLIKLSLNIFIENRINIYISKYVYYKLYINSNNDTYLVLEILVLQYRLDERV